MEDSVKKLLVPVAVLLAAGSVVLTWARGSQHAQLLNDARQLQGEVNNMQVRRLVFQRLAQDLVLYSQQNPNIDAVLVPMGLKNAPALQQTGQPTQQRPQSPGFTTPTTPRR